MNRKTQADKYKTKLIITNLTDKYRIESEELPCMWLLMKHFVRRLLIVHCDVTLRCNDKINLNELFMLIDRHVEVRINCWKYECCNTLWVLLFPKHLFWILRMKQITNKQPTSLLYFFKICLYISLEKLRRILFSLGFLSKVLCLNLYLKFKNL